MNSVVSVASLASAAALPAAPIAASEQDPIFPALDAFARSWAEIEAAGEAAGIIEDSLGDYGRDHSRVVIGHVKSFETGEENPVYALCHEAIDMATGLSEAVRRRLHVALDADTAQLEQIHQLSGLKTARERETAAWNQSGRLLRLTAATVPTTPAGVAAFTVFLRQEIFCERGSPGEDVTQTAWRTLATATARLSALRPGDRIADNAHLCPADYTSLDAKLIALGRRVDAETAEAGASRERYFAIEKEWQRRTERPKALYARKSDPAAWKIDMLPEGRGYGGEAIERLRAVAKSGDTAPLRDRAREIVAVSDGWVADYNALELELGVNVAEEAYDAALRKIDQMWAAVAELHAHTIEGLCVKARLGAWQAKRMGEGLYDDRDSFADDVHAIGANLIRDLVLLGPAEGGAASVAATHDAARVAAPPGTEIDWAVREHQAALSILQKLLGEQGAYEESVFRTGGAPDDRFEERVDEASKAELDAAWNVISIVPKTAPGLAALLRYVREDREMAGHLEDKRYLWMLYSSIEDFVCDSAGLPTPARNPILGTT